MNNVEENALSQRIEGTVTSWLSTQDELTRAIHLLAVDLIQIACDAPPEVIVELFPQFHSDLWCDHGALTVTRRVVDFLDSEFTELSALLTDMLQQFNIRYFDGTLADYKVNARHNIPLPTVLEASCQEEIMQRELLIIYNGWPNDMIARLIHLMAHVKAGLAHGILTSPPVSDFPE